MAAAATCRTTNARIRYVPSTGGKHMTINVHHVHVKTRDPKGTVQFYVDNLGATMTADRGTRGYTVRLHGLQLNITPIIDSQTREQRYGLEHIAVDTDDYAG